MTGNKPLRQTEQRTKQLKQISDYFLSDVQDSSTGEASVETMDSIRPDRHYSLEKADKTTKAGKKNKPDKHDKTEKTGKSDKKGAKIKSGKNGKSRKHGKKEKAGKNKTSIENGKKGKSGRGKKSRKIDKKNKSSKDKKSHKHGKKEKTAAAKPTKQRETVKERLVKASEASASVSAEKVAPLESRAGAGAPIPPLPEADKTAPEPRADTATAVKAAHYQDGHETTHKPAPPPPARSTDTKTPASKRRAVQLVLMVSLIALFGLWGYQHWFTEPDIKQTVSNRTGTTSTGSWKYQPRVAVTPEKPGARALPAIPIEKTGQAKVTIPAQETAPPPAANPPVRYVNPPGRVVTGKSQPETAAAPPAATRPVMPQPRPGYPPQSYGQPPSYPGWRQPPYYGNYPQQFPYRQPQPR